MIALGSIDSNRHSTRFEKVVMAMFLLFIVCVLSYVVVTDGSQPPQQTPQATAVSFGPDLEARKHNTPALFESLNRYARADKAFRAEFGTYTGPQDVDYAKLKPLLDELRDSVADVNERLKNFDSLQAKGRTGDEAQQVASNRLLE